VWWCGVVWCGVVWCGVCGRINLVHELPCPYAVAACVMPATCVCVAVAARRVQEQPAKECGACFEDREFFVRPGLCRASACVECYVRQLSVRTGCGRRGGACTWRPASARPRRCYLVPQERIRASDLMVLRDAEGAVRQVRSISAHARAAAAGRVAFPDLPIGLDKPLTR
jgi:hypothetical protein